MEDFDEDFCQCPRCSGFGEVACHCGGDLCLCENYGERPCPLCWGEGEVSEVVFNLFMDAQRENARLLAEAIAKVDAEKAAHPTPEAP